MSNIPQVFELLDQFSTRPGAEQYRKEGEKIRLLCEFLRFRQIVGIDFPTFLDRYYELYVVPEGTPSRDPEAVVDRFLPRLASAANRLRLRQWAAKEVREFLAIYVGTVMDAEQAGASVMSLEAMLTAGIQQGYLDGEFSSLLPAKKRGRAPKADNAAEPAEPAEPAVPPVPTPHTTSVTPQVTPAAAPAVTAKLDVGAPVIFTETTVPGSREYRGKVYTFVEHDGQKYATVVTDYGEMFSDLSLRVLRPYSGDYPETRDIPEVAVHIDRSEYVALVDATRSPLPTEPVAPIFSKSYPIPAAPAFKLLLEIFNGSGRPLLTASLLSATETGPDGSAAFVCTAEGPPRRNPLGYYEFNFPDDTGLRCYLLRS